MTLLCPRKNQNNPKRWIELGSIVDAGGSSNMLPSSMSILRDPEAVCRFLVRGDEHAP